MTEAKAAVPGSWDQGPGQDACPKLGGGRALPETEVSGPGFTRCPPLCSHKACYVVGELRRGNKSEACSQLASAQKGQLVQV